MARALLNNLKALDIQLWAEGDKLKWDAPRGLVKGNLKEQMREHKAELLALLRDKEADAYHQGSDSTSSKEEQHKIDPVSEDTNKKLPLNTIILGDCLEKLKAIPDNSIDLIVTDPPFGIGFMGKAWDTFKPNYINDKIANDGRGTADGIISARPALVAGTYDRSVNGNKAFQNFICEISKECLRVLKPGAFMFMCMTPRQDSLVRTIAGIEDAGFKIGFTSMYWTYASGFPKARNISKAIDKKFGAERKKLGRNPNSRENCDKSNTIYESGSVGKTAYHTEPSTVEAKKLDGSYAGFQPKPAVEVIVVTMKPCEKKTYADQALSNGKGCTCFDECRIPYKDEKIWSAEGGVEWSPERKWNSDHKRFGNEKGRLPANLLVSDDILDDGRKDPGGFSRFFSLDAWAEVNLQNLPELIQRNLPFLIVPKASKKEKDAGLENINSKSIGNKGNGLGRVCEHCGAAQLKPCDCEPKSWINPKVKNNHPTVKPIKLMAYLITMGSRENDIVLDPFAGSGSTCIAAKILNRRYIGIELSSEYREIAVRRLENLDKDDTIKKSIHEAFEKVIDLESEKNKNTQNEKKSIKENVCINIPGKRLDDLPV